MDIEYLKAIYPVELPKYEILGRKLGTILNEILEESRVHTIGYRVKGIESLIGKIVDKPKYDVLTDITDLCGLRIITNLESDIEYVENILRQNFNIDEANCRDHRKRPANDFGYLSLHLVLSLGPDRENLPENIQIKGLKAEVQIRSILQHAWAEIEHDLGYKNSEDIPDDLKRGANRLSAILEAADLEFVRLKNLKLAHIQAASNAIAFKSESNTIIDTINIQVLDENSGPLNAIRDMLADKYQIRFIKKNNYNNVFRNFIFFGISYLEQLEKDLNNNKKFLIKFVDFLFSRRTDKPQYIRFEAPLEYYLHFLGSANDEEYWDAYRHYGSSDCKNTITEVTDFIQLHKDSIQ